MLLDTSGLLSYFDRASTHHGDAVSLFHSAATRLTHNYALAEFIALCQARGLNRLATLSFTTELLDTPHVQVIWVDETLHRAALVFLQARLDKTYSLCDAVSMLLMQQHALTDALTTDHHFEQAGFVRLLKP